MARHHRSDGCAPPKSSEPDDQIDTVVQPDVIITRDKSKIDTRGVRGAPDWLAEVLSPSTASYDRAVKIPVYERAGVPEVWLIDPKRHSIVFTDSQAAQYGPADDSEDERPHATDSRAEVSVDWDRVNARALNED